MTQRILQDILGQRSDTLAIGCIMRMDDRLQAMFPGDRQIQRGIASRMRMQDLIVGMFNEETILGFPDLSDIRSLEGRQDIDL